MIRPRSALVAVGAWCLVVAVVSTLVWVVIARAGQGVVPDSRPEAATRSLAVPSSPVKRTTARPTRKPPSNPPTSTHTPSARPTSPSTSAPAEPPPSSSPPPSHTSTAPTGPTAQRRSWSGAAGHVVTECRAARGRLVSTYPSTGWRYQVLSRGPSFVRVGFLRVGEHEGIKVTSTCGSGVPHFSTSHWEPGDDGRE